MFAVIPETVKFFAVMVCDRTVDVLPAKIPAAPYTAVMEWGEPETESVLVENVATPGFAPFNIPVPNVFVPSLKVTVPVGAPPLAGVTVAVNVTDDPYTDEVAEELTVVVVLTGLMVNVCAFEVPPPGTGFTTVIDAVPTAAISAAVIVDVTEELETNPVARAEPLKSTTDPETKFVPLTVTMKLAPPAVVEVGLMEVVVGTGFKTTNAVDVAEPPPGVGLVNTIVEVPVVAVLAVVKDMVSCVDDATVVALLAPLKVAVVFALKPVPVMVRVGEYSPTSRSEKTWRWSEPDSRR